MKSKIYNLFKTIIYIWIFLSFSIHTHAQNTSIPDANFEQALIDLGFDTAPTNGMIPTVNINTITSLDLTNKNIADLTGIDDFAALNFLTLTNNNLTTLDVSSNGKLIAMSCNENQLTSLTLPATNFFQGLFCNDNLLTSINITGNPNLKTLKCYNNKLTGELDISNNPKLETIYCYENQLTSLKFVQQNNTILKELYCGFNNLSAIDVSKFSSLEFFNCSKNNISNLNVSSNTKLIDFFFLENNISDIDVTQNTKLVQLGTGKNPLGELDVTQNINLENLGCYENELQELDISNNSKLQRLSCYINQISNLDLSNKPNLIHLWVYGNTLGILDLSQKPNLERLSCGVNNIESLDLSQNPKLTQVECRSNELTYLNVKNGANTLIAEFKTTGNPNLTCIIVDDKNYSTTNWTDIDNDTSFLESDAACQALAIENFAIEGFKLYPNPVRDQLTITGKNLMVDEVIIYDHTGRMVKNIQWNGKSTRLNNLAPGMYILRIKTDQGTTAKKILKI